MSFYSAGMLFKDVHAKSVGDARCPYDSLSPLPGQTVKEACVLVQSALSQRSWGWQAEPHLPPQGRTGLQLCWSLLDPEGLLQPVCLLQAQRLLQH